MKLNLKTRSGLGYIDGKLCEIRKLTRTGRGFVITIPKLWVELYCKPKEDVACWVGFEQNGNTITIKGYKADGDDRHKGN